jgi:hypothetical protein
LPVGSEVRILSVRISGAPAKILTGHLPNENWKDSGAQISSPGRPVDLILCAGTYLMSHFWGI